MAKLGGSVMAKHKLIHVEEGTITSMANNPAVVKEFPFLASVRKLKARRPGCGRCGAARTGTAAVYGAVKSTIAGLDGSKKRRLKELLGADKVRVRYTSGSRTLELTF
jgi:hypothetical protein